MIQKLPQELLVKIFSYLSVEDLAVNVKCVCKLWERVSQVNSIWKEKSYNPYHYTPVSRIVRVLEESPKLEIFNFLNLYINDMSSHDAIEDVYRVLMCHSMCIKKLVIFVDCFNHYSVRNLLVARCRTIVSLDITFQIYNMTDAMKHITQVMRCVGECVNLRDLILSGPFISEESALKAVANACVFLQSLNVEMCDILEIRVLDCLLDRKRDTIVSMKLPWACHDNCTTLPVIARHCKKLEALSFCHPTDKNIVEVPCKDFLKNMHLLKDLFMLHIPYSISNTTTLLYTAAFENLVNLNLNYNIRINNQCINIIFNKCSKLKRLELKGCCGVNSAGFECIYLLRDLQYLDLEQCSNLCDEAMVYIVKCKFLKYLNMKYIKHLTSDTLSLCCDNLKHLTVLHLELEWVYHKDWFKVPRHLAKFLKTNRMVHRGCHKYNMDENHDADKELFHYYHV